MISEDSIIDDETLLLLFQNNVTSGIESEFNDEQFVQSVIQKVKRISLIRTVVLSVMVGICAIYLFPQIQPLVSTSIASFTYLFSSLPTHFTDESLESLMLPLSVLSLSLISILLLDWSAD